MTTLLFFLHYIKLILTITLYILINIDKCM